MSTHSMILPAVGLALCLATLPLPARRRYPLPVLVVVTCALGAVVVIGLFGEALQLSHWVLDISPFTHAPRLPGGPVSAASLLWLCLAAVAFSAFGLAALRRRDLG